MKIKEVIVNKNESIVRKCSKCGKFISFGWICDECDEKIRTKIFPKEVINETKIKASYKDIRERCP